MNEPARVPPSLVTGRARLAAAVLIAALAVFAQGIALGEAATITNRDVREYRLSIEVETVTDDRILKPNEALKDVCPKRCVVRLDNGSNDQYELESSDVVSIEDGFVYYDGAEINVPQAAPGVEKPPVK